MFIHYNDLTKRVTGYTDFVSEVPSVWEEPTVEISTFEFLYDYSEYELQNGILVHVGKTIEQINLELNLYKTNKIMALSQACETEIVSGFMSNALGAPHTYQSDRDDQLNLIGMVASGTDDYFKCFDFATSWGYKLHTASQLLQVLNDGKNTKLIKLQKFNTLKEQVLSATTKEEIDLIVW